MAASTTPDPRSDRLYQLLPAIYRMRDAENGYPLRALLRVIAEEVNVVEDNISQLYDNWFIETAEDWAVPYVADLIGYRPVLDAGPLGATSSAEGRELNRLLIPRREVANTIHNRRRKGTLALLEMLANDVAAWPARAAEFFKLLGWNQNINHLWLERARTVDVRKLEELDLIDGPFDPSVRTVDCRRLSSHRVQGRYNIPSVGLFVWRLKSYSVTHSSAFCAEGMGPNCFSFSVLGQDAPLYIKPESEPAPTHIAEELNLPAPIRRRAFAKEKGAYYDVAKSLVIWAEGWTGFEGDGPVPAELIVPADLSGWQYAPASKQIAVDPILGRLAFPIGQLPRQGVKVSYHYAFSADMGGGEYSRQIFNPSPREELRPDPQNQSKTVRQSVAATFYCVGTDQEFTHIGDALARWNEEKPNDAVIELTDSAVYVEPLAIKLAAEQTLQLRAKSGTRPVIRLLDWQTELPDALSVFMEPRSRFTLDGLLVTGRSLYVHGPVPENPEDPRAPVCGSELVIRHSTLVPGWGIDCDCEPQRPTEPSLELYQIRARVRIEHSIIGSIQIHEDEVNLDPIPLCITDSILDATSPEREAIGSPGYAVAHACLTIKRCTVFGIVDVHAVELAEDSIFSACLNVARRQLGCMRFCFIPRGCRTPRRYRCQPDLVIQAAKETLTDPAQQAARSDSEARRIRPQFTSHRYGNPGYAQLALTCADEIKRGATDESEMGAFHDLFQPQREANLRARLEEFTPVGMDAAIIFVN